VAVLRLPAEVSSGIMSANDLDTQTQDLLNPPLAPALVACLQPEVPESPTPLWVRLTSSGLYSGALTLFLSVQHPA
jgi:hypothetical protein